MIMHKGHWHYYNSIASDKILTGWKCDLKVLKIKQPYDIQNDSIVLLSVTVM